MLNFGDFFFETVSQLEKIQPFFQVFSFSSLLSVATDDSK